MTIIPAEPAKPKCKICQRVKQEANGSFRVERVEKDRRIVGMRWSRLLPVGVLDPAADFVCGPGCLAKETPDLAQKVIEEEELL